MREILWEKCGLNETAPVLVAVSGGAGSLPLFHVLHASGYPLICATFNHRLRPQARDEVEHGRRIAEGRGLPLVSDTRAVAGCATGRGLSGDGAGRHLR